MKASILTSERNVIANNELRVLTVWGHLFEKRKRLFAKLESFIVERLENWAEMSVKKKKMDY